MELIERVSTTFVNMEYFEFCRLCGGRGYLMEDGLLPGCTACHGRGTVPCQDQQSDVGGSVQSASSLMMEEVDDEVPDDEEAWERLLDVFTVLAEAGAHRRGAHDTGPGAD